MTSSSSNYANPVDSKTFSESTTRLDARGRPIYQTAWLSARGQIDPSNPPIAGIDGVALADGLTTQYLYDSNLTDGQGLDSSAGVTVSKTGNWRYRNLQCLAQQCHRQVGRYAGQRRCWYYVQFDDGSRSRQRGDQRRR